MVWGYNGFRVLWFGVITGSGFYGLGFITGSGFYGLGL